ncbi:hypothetical protein HRTV-25_gp57 [Halorubrum tailed virus 25]|uniref:Uncharacterized protein n=1 Tax=Halorubrum tailed virus 25 TaxID=2878006 RepID=A0AAE9BYW1_9CAUD|nr:hypothetical protein M1M37_gp057 [Halorubrum tailed virus 25]UBF22638.1 hypothetical protein HRTV-25_gp57 [Halorubrum tailed virus 25]
MTRYERRVLAVDDDGGFDVEGRVVAVLDSPRAGARQVTALVELAEEQKTPAPSTFQGVSEGVAASKQTWFCGEEKSDGKPCTREVDEPDDTCWQH